MSPGEGESPVKAEMDAETFEELMKERTRVRKEKEDYSVAELRVKIHKLEQALTAEVKRRVESTAHVERNCKIMVKDMEERLLKRLEEQEHLWTARMKELEDRVTVLETSQAETSKEQSQRISQKGQELKLQLTTVERALHEESKARLIREGRFLQQLESYSKDFDDRWRQEQGERIQQVEQLTSTLSQHQQQQAASIRSWQAQVTTELDELKKEMEAEVHERQEEDEEIVKALHKYSQQLQHSLSILNGDDEL